LRLRASGEKLVLTLDAQRRKGAKEARPSINFVTFGREIARRDRAAKSRGVIVWPRRALVAPVIDLWQKSRRDD
jgi:hypothetical protein